MSRNAIFTLGLVAILVMIGADADAASIKDTVQGWVTGNIGLAIGLILAVFGIWTWVVKQETMAGIFLIIGGVLITIAPGVMNTMSSFINPITSGFGGSNTNVTGANTSNATDFQVQ